MSQFRPLFLFFALFLAAAIALSCGGIGRVPESVSVTPATADGTSGPVQFTAAVYYNRAPSPVSPASATWGACAGDTSKVSVSTNGLAQCSSGPTRTYIIYASVPIPNFKGVCNGDAVPCGGSCGAVVGTALLTCQ